MVSRHLKVLFPVFCLNTISSDQGLKEKERTRKQSLGAMNEIAISGYVPGAIGRLAELHAQYYSMAWDFGLFFEAKVAAEMSEFMRIFDDGRDSLWIVSRDGSVEGGIVIDGTETEDKGAHLRWFILSERLRGQGLGNRLMGEAVGFCRERCYRQVYLWTFQGLHPARHLYEKFGFKLADQRPGQQWGKEVLEQRFVLVLP
jgi:GNAT superfamily N-acetyltransferase